LYYCFDTHCYIYYKHKMTYDLDYLNICDSIIVYF
jgi:hypothetical protein